jgi:hypothetical protein
MKKTVLLTLATFTFLAVFSQTVNKKNSNKTSISSSQNTEPLPGAYQLQEYLPLLKGKRVGIFANNTSTVGILILLILYKSLGLRLQRYLDLNMVSEERQVQVKKLITTRTRKRTYPLSRFMAKRGKRQRKTLLT